MNEAQPPDIHLVMATQHGAASTAQVRETMRWRKQNSLIEDHVWQRNDPRVVSSRSAPETWLQRMMVATLATRGVASHASAARLHRLDGFDRTDDVHVTLRYNQRRHAHPGTRVHVSRILEASDRISLQGIPSVILPVCLIQIADRSDDQMVQALEGAMRNGINPAWIRQVAARYARPGSSASRRLVGALDERVDGVLPRSWFQRLASRLLTDSGIPTSDEHPIHEGRRLLAELDLAIPDLKIGLECQSWRWHATPAAQRRDTLRKRAIRRLGWEILDLWWSDLDRMDDILGTLRIIIAERLAKPL